MKLTIEQKRALLKRVADIYELVWRSVSFKIAKSGLG